MLKIVLDTSVIIKWFNVQNENYTEQAKQISQRAASGEIILYAPELAKYEIGNVLIKGKRFTQAEATKAFNIVKSLVNFIQDDTKTLISTFILAKKSDITFYDAAFISLAQNLKTPLVTENIKHQKTLYYQQIIDIKDFV